MSQYSYGLNRNGESACVSEAVRERGICLFSTQSLTHFLITSVIYWSLSSAPNNKRAVNQLCYCKLKSRRNDLEVYTASWLICVVHYDTQAVKKSFYDYRENDAGSVRVEAFSTCTRETW